MLVKVLLKMYSTFMIDADERATCLRDTDSLSESEFKKQSNLLCLLLAEAEAEDDIYWVITYENQLAWLCEQNPSAARTMDAVSAALRDKDTRRQHHLGAEALLRGIGNIGCY